MPTLYNRVDGPGAHILDSVTNQVVTGLLDELDLIRYFKDAVYYKQPFSAYSQYDDGQGALSLNKNRCDVEVNYVLDKSQVPWPVETPYTTTALGLRSNKKGIHTPLLYDEKADILIEQHNTPCALEMEFTLNFQSFDDAARAFDTIQSKHKGTLVQKPYDIAFSYPVTMSMYAYLLSAFNLKKDYVGKEFMDWINDVKVAEFSFDVRKSQMHLEEADVALMVRNVFLGCPAQLTMESKEPEVNRVEQLPDSFSVRFSMVFQFPRPTVFAIHTPISIDNQVLPYVLFEHLDIESHWAPMASGIYGDLMVHEYMKRSYGQYAYMGQLLRIPTYDDWFTADSLYSYFEYRPLITAHFTLDGPTTTINLAQLSDIELHPILQAILKETGPAALNYGGIFHLGVYAGKQPMGTDIVTLDHELNLTIRSDRPDKEYHLVLSETTAINKTAVEWDHLLIKYRYFFPMSIERNLDYLLEKGTFQITYNDAMLSLVHRLFQKGTLKARLKTMIELGECFTEIYAYTQNPAQISDYLAATRSQREDYTLPLVDPSDPTSPPLDVIDTFYKTYASVEGRSLLVAFLEQCLIEGDITLDTLPKQFLRPNPKIYPYSVVAGGYYGFNTPLRVLTYNIHVRH